MRDKDKCCGKCRYHAPDDTFPNDWICVNDGAEACGDYVEYDDYCESFEERKEKCEKA